MLKKVIAVLFVVLALFALSACSLFKDDTTETTETEREATMTADAIVDTTVATTVEIIAEEEDTPVIEIDIWDGIVADGFAGGDGTEKFPYQISKASQLAFLAKSVNEGNLYTDNYFVLVCDINLNNIEWTPIGNIDFPFDGYFDGNGQIVSVS